MQPNEPAWLAPEMRDEAIRRLREGDDSLSREWITLVTSRYAAITQSRMDQARAVIRDAPSQQGPQKVRNTTDRAH